MNTIETYLGLKILIFSILSILFVLTSLMSKDELEQDAFDHSLKTSSVLSIILTIVFVLYLGINGIKTVDIGVILYGCGLFCGLAMLLYYLALKNICFEISVKNNNVANIMVYISTIISVLSGISILFSIDLFSNEVGFLRYDEAILILNLLLFFIVISILVEPKKLTLKEYKALEKENTKFFNILVYIYFGLMIASIVYLVYAKFG